MCLFSGAGTPSVQTGQDVPIPIVTESEQTNDALNSMERIDLNSVSYLLRLVYDMTAWKQLEQERERLIGELQEALGNLKTPCGLIPICAGCKYIRDDQGYWNNLGSYLEAHTDVDFSHGVAPRAYSDYILTGAVNGERTRRSAHVFVNMVQDRGCHDSAPTQCTIHDGCANSRL